MKLVDFPRVATGKWIGEDFFKEESFENKNLLLRFVHFSTNDADGGDEIHGALKGGVVKWGVLVTCVVTTLLGFFGVDFWIGPGDERGFIQMHFFGFIDKPTDAFFQSLEENSLFVLSGNFHGEVGFKAIREDDPVLGQFDFGDGDA